MNLYIGFMDSLIHVKCWDTITHMKTMHSFILDNANRGFRYDNKHYY